MNYDLLLLNILGEINYKLMFSIVFALFLTYIQKI